MLDIFLYQKNKITYLLFTLKKNYSYVNQNKIQISNIKMIVKLHVITTSDMLAIIFCVSSFQNAIGLFFLLR